MSTKRETRTTGNLIVQKDPETGEIFIALPKKTLNRLGWTEDDELEWIENPDGTWQVNKLEKKK